MLRNPLKTKFYTQKGIRADSVIESPHPPVCTIGSSFFKASHWPWDHMISSKAIIKFFKKKNKKNKKKNFVNFSNQKKSFIFNYVCFGIDATIRIGREIQCLPYAGFFHPLSDTPFPLPLIPFYRVHRNWALGLDITILACLFACLFACLSFCPLRRGCVNLLSIKLRSMRMEWCYAGLMLWLNDGLIEWWNNGMIKWWNDEIMEWMNDEMMAWWTEV